MLGTNGAPVIFIADFSSLLCHVCAIGLDRDTEYRKRALHQHATYWRTSEISFEILVLS
ncbi:hypothetical protein O6H91_09G102800 [Diphasiastrum complanatum]|uniref:Uncharacterized protein n=1 Tax=Diphasiastrum complanatum TaxID=34168 RepID=A0ACC2CSI7_DIPCM|nr:hypothetical protein O6H91_09G102800 [Diphasiastrum complanatum]